MPIKGLSEQRRLPRLGKIHLGYKKISERTGKEYPVATEYFVIPRELEQYLGVAPTEIPIMIPVEDEEIWASQYYKRYSRTRGLTCRGDGVTCKRMVDAQTGAMADRETKEVVWKEGLPCLGRQCPDYLAKECKETMNLQFIMPDIPGLGIWQVDTSSINSIRNINSASEMIRAVYKRISFIPLLLTLEPQEVINPDDGKKKTVRCLQIRARGTLRDLMIEAAKPVTELLLPGPVEDEPPLDMESAESEPKQTQATTRVPIISKEPEVAPKTAAPEERAGAAVPPKATAPPIETKPPQVSAGRPAAAVQKAALPPTDTKSALGSAGVGGVVPTPAAAIPPTATKPAAPATPAPEPAKAKSTASGEQPIQKPKTETRTASRIFISELKKANLSDDDIKKILFDVTGKKAGWTADDIKKARAYYEAQAKELLEKGLTESQPNAEAADAFLREQSQS
jgi:hypothetical protein